MASRFRRRLVTFFLVLYAAFVAVITLTPRMPGSGLLNRLVLRFLSELHRRGITWIDFLAIEFIGNVLMFLPLGLFAALLIPRRAWWSLLFLGTVSSAFIEFFQSVFLPGRVPEVRDLMSNTIGFLLGALFAISMRLLVAHRDTLVEHDRRAAVIAK